MSNKSLTRAGLKRRAYTLIELILFATLWSLLAVATFRVVGDSRVVRGRAEDRLQMLQIAQSELDRLRVIGIADVSDTPFRRDNWPAGLFAEVKRDVRGNGTIEVTISVTRPESIEGTEPVSLTTLLAEAQP